MAYINIVRRWLISMEYIDVDQLLARAEECRNAKLPPLNPRMVWRDASGSGLCPRPAAARARGKSRAGRPHDKAEFDKSLWRAMT